MRGRAGLVAAVDFDGWVQNYVNYSMAKDIDDNIFIIPKNHAQFMTILKVGSLCSPIKVWAPIIQILSCTLKLTCWKYHYTTLVWNVHKTFV